MTGNLTTSEATTRPSTPPDPDTTADLIAREIAARIAELDRHVGAYVERRLHAAGHGSIRRSHRKVLAQLGKTRTISQTARLAGVSRQTMRQLLGDLERLGYVVIARSARYDRRLIPKLTAKGRAWREAEAEAVADLGRAWESRLERLKRIERLEGPRPVQKELAESHLGALLPVLGVLAQVTRGRVVQFAGAELDTSNRGDIYGPSRKQTLERC